MMERSLISARRCFVEAQRNLNLIHEGNYYVLQEWYDYIDEYHHIDCDLIVYIQTDPKIAFQRIQARAREEESTVTLEYVKEVHDLHEKVFVQRASDLPTKSILILDGNLGEEEMMREFKKCEAEIFK
jgi:thymidylate kinase